VILTSISLWLIAFQTYYFKAVGLVMMLLPHLLGAPQPEHHGFANTDPTAVTELTQLWHSFVIQTSIANALLWIVIGALAGFLTKKYIYPIAKSGNNYV
jgi:predicted cobalt transporter CbtA